MFIGVCMLTILLFYLIPIFIKIPFVLIVMLLFFVMFISFIFSLVYKNKLKYLYPFIISIGFIPSSFIFYNESALIHALWYFIGSMIFVLLGSISMYFGEEITKWRR